MKYRLWQDLNSLLAYLRSFNAVGLVHEEFYVKYGNIAPGQLLQEQMDTVQKHLDMDPPESEDKPCPPKT